METNSPAEKFADIIGDVPEDFAEIFEQISGLLCVDKANIIPALTKQLDEIQGLCQSISDKKATIEEISYESLEKQIDVYKDLDHDVDKMEKMLSKYQSLILDYIVQLHNIKSIALKDPEGNIIDLKIDWNKKDNSIEFSYGLVCRFSTKDFKEISLEKGTRPWMKAEKGRVAKIDKTKALAILKQLVIKILTYVREGESSLKNERKYLRGKKAIFKAIETQMGVDDCLKQEGQPKLRRKQIA